MYKQTEETELFNGKAFYSSIQGYKTVFAFKGNLTQTRKLVIARHLLEKMQALGKVKPEVELTERVVKELIFYGHIEKQLIITKRRGILTTPENGVSNTISIDLKGENFSSNLNELNKYELMGIG